MILLRGARQLVTLRGRAPRRGIHHRELGIISDGAVLIDGEKIREVGLTRRIENLAAARDAQRIDVSGKVVLPGFVDSHTHPVFARLKPSGGVVPLPDNPLRLPSASLPAPPSSGIRSIAPKGLALNVKRWATRFASQGTTTLDARSGQGLSEPSELKGLKAAATLERLGFDITRTFVAGAAKSADWREDPESATEQVTDVLLPLIERRKLAGFCDVECGPEAFSLEQTKLILEAAARLGFRLKVQTDRDAPTGALRVAVEMGALSADHLECITDADIDLAARSPIVATLLPATGYQSGMGRFAPGRALIDRGAAVALATGFGDPLNPTPSMPMVLSMACTQMGLTAEESICAATINGAAAMGLADKVGSLEPDKQADLAVFDVGDYREIPYYFGASLCALTLKKGKVFYRRS